MFLGDDFEPLDGDDWLTISRPGQNYGSKLIDFGSNMAVLTHPDVKGITVRREPGGGLEIEVFAFHVTPSLKLLIKEEYGEHSVRYLDASLGPRVPDSAS